jgi:hypothetical protein
LETPNALARQPAAGYRRRASDSFKKVILMHKLSLAFVIFSGLALPAFAQQKEAAKSPLIPTNTFFKGQTSSQYLARDQLIGAKVTNKDGQTVGTVDDLIIGSGDRIEGIVMGVGGFLGVGAKQIGVRLAALKVSRSDGKLTVSLPVATKEMLGAVEAYQRGSAPAKK